MDECIYLFGEGKKNREILQYSGSNIALVLYNNKNSEYRNI